MWTRRQFLTRGGGTALALAGGGLMVNAFAPQDQPPPGDGAAARGMVNRAAQTAIDQGLAFLEVSQHPDGSFGTGPHQGNIAITSLGGLAMMAGGHQPGRGRYGQVVTRALQFIVSMDQERPRAGFLNNPRAPLHGPMYGHGFGTLFLA